MHYQASFSYLRGSITGPVMEWLIETGELGFNPVYVRIEPAVTRSGRCTSKRLLTALRRSGTLLSLDLAAAPSGESPELSLHQRFSCTVLNLRVTEDVALRASVFLLLAEIPGFVAGYVAEADDEFWQNQSLPETFETFGRDYDKSKVSGSRRDRRIDIRGNPGRQFELPGMVVTSAWRMWFSPLADPYLPRAKAREFTAATRCEQVGEVLFVELYRDGGNPDLPAARAIQEEFRVWMNMNALEEQSPQLLGETQGDPIYEVDTGEVNGVPVVLLTTWLDQHGHHVNRSRACKRWMALTRRDGPKLWSVIQSPPFEEVELSETPPPRNA